jgi:hypothetical protein
MFDVLIIMDAIVYYAVCILILCVRGDVQHSNETLNGIIKIRERFTKIKLCSHVYNAEGIRKLSSPKNNARRRMMRTKWSITFKRGEVLFVAAGLISVSYHCVGLARNGLWVLWLLKTFKKSDCCEAIKSTAIYQTIEREREMIDLKLAPDAWVNESAASWWSLGVSIHLFYYLQNQLWI